MQSLERILNTVGLNVKLHNPFGFATKGQMVASCKHQIALQDTFAKSASCGKRGHKVSWNIRNARQCGVCMPCIYRRAALHKNGWDNETYGSDLLAISDPRTAPKDIKALFDFLKTALTLKDITRNLLVNGSLEHDKLDQYAQVVHNSRAEILAWIAAKGNDDLKGYLGLQ